MPADEAPKGADRYVPSVEGAMEIPADLIEEYAAKAPKGAEAVAEMRFHAHWAARSCARRRREKAARQVEGGAEAFIAGLEARL